MSAPVPAPFFEIGPKNLLRRSEIEAVATAAGRAGELGLQTVVCAGTQEHAVRFAAQGPTIVLFEPPELIGTGGTGPRDWVGPSTEAVHRASDGVLAMHAGGVSSPEVAEALMAAGADGTGSTSGVLNATDPGLAVHSFIAATRSGWERAHR